MAATTMAATAATGWDRVGISTVATAAIIMAATAATATKAVLTDCNEYQGYPREPGT
jgi:hypothetical protein